MNGLLIAIFVIVVVILVLQAVSFCMIVAICRMIDGKFDEDISQKINSETYKEFKNKIEEESYR